MRRHKDTYPDPAGINKSQCFRSPTRISSRHGGKRALAGHDSLDKTRRTNYSRVLSGPIQPTSADTPSAEAFIWVLPPLRSEATLLAR